VPDHDCPRKRGRPPRREGELTRSRSYSLTEAGHQALADYALAHGHPSASAGLQEMVEKFAQVIVDGAD
jgi:DNA-binding PadR family transcriptional regulator